MGHLQSPCSTFLAIILCFGLRFFTTNHVVLDNNRLMLDHWTAPIDASPKYDCCPVSLFHVSLHITNSHRHWKNFTLQRTNIKSRLSLLLMLAGDINPNPGPSKAKPNVKYPCQICYRAAKRGQDCIACDSCNGWFHKTCLGMSEEVFNALAQHDSCSWLCADCGMPNFHSSLFTDLSDVETNNSFDVLSDLSEDFPDDKPTKTSSPVKDKCNSNKPRKVYKIRNSTRSKPKPKIRNLKILNVNCQSVRAKLAGFLCLLHEEDADIVVGTESWLHSNITTGEIFPSNYNIFRKDREKDGDSHGGVFIAAKSDLIAQDEPDLDQQNCELKWVSIHVSGTAPVYVGAFYRSQTTNSEYVRLLENSLEKIPKQSSVWILGDFNLPDIDWAINSFKPCGRYPGPSKNMIDIAMDHNLQQVVLTPTRNDNILDLCFTNSPAFLDKVEIKPGISDHDVVIIHASIKPKMIKLPKRKIFLYKKAEYSKICEDLNQLNNKLTNKFVQESSVDELWEHFTSTILESMDDNIPSRITSSKPSIPWINTNMKRNIRKKRKLYDKARKSGDPEHWDKFKQLRRKNDKEMRKLHQEHIRNIGDSLHSENTKPFWNYVKALRKDVFGVSSLTSAGRIVSDAKEKAETLNDQFCSVFTEENLTSIPNLGPSSVPDMPDIHITTAGVEKLLKNLKVNKASGPDNIPARVLKECASSVAPIFQKIYQKSVTTGILPQDWLKANVSPIFKKGDRSLPINYRPVSLTCIACKQLEHILYTNIIHHFEDHLILNDKQHGFRSGRSCETQLAGLVDDLARTLDNRGRTDVCIMDFSKAFDTVPHQRLLLKLDHLGIRSHIKRWIAGFLTKRQQRVVLDGQSSSTSPVTSGVPQGTVLGPLLFLAYINDLPDQLISNIRLFADDVILYRPINTPEDTDILQNDINSLHNWEKTWQMKFNISKCFIMNVTHQRKFVPHEYHLGDSILQVVSNHPYLGVNLSNNLSWASHINQTVNKANSVLGLLKRNLWNCSSRTKEIAYKTIVRPRLDYCSSVWDPYQKVHQDSLEKVQRRAARFVTKEYRHTCSVTKMLQNLGWETLQDRREKSRLLTLFKETHNITPSNITRHIDKESSLKPRTRQSHELNYKVTRPNKDCYKYSLYPRTIIKWNGLPAAAKSAPNVATFKLIVDNISKTVSVGVNSSH